MKKLKRLHVRKCWVPNCVAYAKGVLHAKRRLVSVENGTIRSPYLLERRFSYAEYKEKLLHQSEEILRPMKQQKFKVELERSLLVEKKEILDNKLSKLAEPKTGNECRAKLQLEKERETHLLEIAEAEARMQEIEENIQLTKQLTLHLLEQNLARLQSKAYVYISGVEAGLKDSRYYLDKEDAVRDVFAGLMPSTI